MVVLYENIYRVPSPWISRLPSSWKINFAVLSKQSFDLLRQRCLTAIVYTYCDEPKFEKHSSVTTEKLEEPPVVGDTAKSLAVEDGPRHDRVANGFANEETTDSEKAGGLSVLGKVVEQFKIPTETVSKNMNCPKSLEEVIEEAKALRIDLMHIRQDLEHARKSGEARLSTLGDMSDHTDDLARLLGELRMVGKVGDDLLQLT